MIPQDKIEEIKNKADIVQIISEYIALKKRGQNYLGLCPFHSEKTPSFIVSEQKKIFHCFGCGEGGNVISFIMRRENVDFLEALEVLATKIGIPLDLPKPTTHDTENNLLKNLIEQSKIFFQNQLNTPAGEKARTYLKTRGLDEKTIRFFEIGFAPDEWEALTLHLLKRGFKKEDMEKAGLSIKHPEKLSFYDRFRNRIMFPIFDAKGHAIAFGGRILGEGEPKYLNSPDTPLYQKSRHLFGLNFAKKESAQKDTFLIVEGYLDLIACHQFGFGHAVATLGTALTAEQAQLMSRWRKKFILAFDADNAGLNAALKNIEPLKKIRAQVYIALLKGGKDPDEILHQKGPDFFKEIIHAAMPWVEFKMRQAAQKYDLSKVEDKITGTRHLAQILNEIEDPLEKKEYLKWASRFIQQDEATLKEEMQQQAPARIYAKKTIIPSKPRTKSETAEEIILREMLTDPQKKEALQKELKEEYFSSEINRWIFQKALDKKELKEDNLSAQKALAKILMSENHSQYTQVLGDCVRTIKSDYLNMALSQLREKIRQAEQSKRLDLLPSLQKQFLDLAQEIKSLK